MELYDNEPISETKQQVVYRYPQKPDRAQFSPDQREALDMAVDSKRGRGLDNRLVITGAAGNGKSFVSRGIVEELLSTGHSVAVVAPTAQATYLNKARLPLLGNNFAIGTIHSLGGLRPKRVEGKTVFVRSARNQLAGFDVILTDEVSMVDSVLKKEVYSELKNQVLILVGDLNQLPPVGEPITPMVDGKEQTYILTTNHRQGDGSPILDYGQAIIKAKNFIYPEYKTTSQGMIYDATKDMLKLMEFYFNSEKAKDASYAKIACYTNTSVDKCNKAVRQLKGLPLDVKFIVGEQYIAIEHYFREVLGEKELIISNNEIFTVIGINIKTDENWGYTIYELKIIKQDGAQSFIEVVHEESEKQFKSDLQAIYDLAVESAGRERSDLFKQYHDLKEMYANARDCSAMTVHKLQGMSVENVFLMTGNIRQNHDKNELWRLLYTGTTRASKRLLVIQ